ncbi:MalY/PatB family protein [uncultured Phycicoccus sp.]|uniref:MalY/PatB family protein n=1 Tax=uncultured Phycicoccus sp. TaxID=661422 RepID=UPI0026233737|nr:aminotransferase class I/II-fold pyridoxal phosphate-dependent enzyme [uncultured Phycicoccus sp.]
MATPRTADGPEVGRRQGSDPATLQRHFGTSEGVLPLWIAEPDVDLAPEVTAALRARAGTGWYGYETRPDAVLESFWAWAAARHGWSGEGLRTLVSPSVGTSVGVLIEQMTSPGDGEILQPPVFTDFKPLVTAAGRRPIRNALVRTQAGYRIDLDGLAAVAAEPSTRMLILCSPHNPVGRVWTSAELRQVAEICVEHDVFVLADEIHADITLPPHRFVPFAVAARGIDVAWAATHGPIKSFGLAGVCDTLLVTDRAEVGDRFETRSSQLHLTRNNVFGLAAFDAAYRHGGPWFDDLLALVARNVELLRAALPQQITVAPVEGTYLAWLDLRGLGLEVREIPGWLGSVAGVAMSPGHWFGREGAGFARMTLATPSDTVALAAERLTAAVARR